MNLLPSPLMYYYGQIILFFGELNRLDQQDIESRMQELTTNIFDGKDHNWVKSDTIINNTFTAEISEIFQKFLGIFVLSTSQTTPNNFRAYVLY